MFADDLTCFFGTFGTAHGVKRRKHLCKLQKVKWSPQRCGDGLVGHVTENNKTKKVSLFHLS